VTPTIYTNAKDLTSARQELETYWKVALRSHEWASQKVFEDYKFDKKHTICSLIDKQNLILEVAQTVGCLKKKESSVRLTVTTKLL